MFQDLIWLLNLKFNYSNLHNLTSNHIQYLSKQSCKTNLPRTKYVLEGVKLMPVPWKKYKHFLGKILDENNQNKSYKYFFGAVA